MITHTLRDIDRFNTRQSKIPSEVPKYSGLIKFIEKMNKESLSQQINRNNFGQQAPKVYLKPVTSTDDLICAKINEFMSKITENNHDEIIEQFQTLQFDQVQNGQLIASTIHAGIINCYKYHLQFISLIEFLYRKYPVLNAPLKEEFIRYNNSLHKNVDMDAEGKFIFKKQLLANYEMLVLLTSNNIIFECGDVVRLMEELLQSDDAFSVELLIRLLQILKRQKMACDPSVMVRLKAKIEKNKYPKMIDFLMMDL